MASLNIPLVINEENASKKCKMMIIIGIIIVILLVLMKNHISYDKKIIDKLKKYKRTKYVEMECMNSDNINNTIKNIPVPAKSILLYNINKNTIPVNQVIVIDSENNIIPIESKNALLSKLNKSGINMLFELPNEIMITQIIIDIDLYNNASTNIFTSQIEVKDKNNKIVWNTTMPLNNNSRYIDLYIVKPDIIYPSMSQKLCGKLPYKESSQESRLKYVLAENTW